MADFPFAHNWMSDYREIRKYGTDIIVSDTLREQRRQLRAVPRRVHEFVVTEFDAGDAARLESVLTAMGSTLYEVPYWPATMWLTSSAASGQPVVACSTANRGLYVGQKVMVWGTPTSYEVRTILSFTANDITFTTNLSATWPTATDVVPCHPGRLLDGVPMTRTNHGHREAEVTFEIDITVMPVLAGTAGSTAVVHLPTDSPDAEAEDGQVWTRQLQILDSPSFTVEVEPRGTRMAAEFGYSAIVTSMEEADEVWAVHNTLIGRLNAGWVPTFLADLPARGVALSGTSVLTITACDYASALFPMESRRHLALIRGHGLIEHRRVASTGTGSGTETLTLDSTIASDFDAEAHLLSFLRYARLREDEMVMEWAGPGLGRARLEFVELPLEVPTSV